MATDLEKKKLWDDRIKSINYKPGDPWPLEWGPRPEAANTKVPMASKVDMLLDCLSEDLLDDDDKG